MFLKIASRVSLCLNKRGLVRQARHSPKESCQVENFLQLFVIVDIIAQTIAHRAGGVNIKMDARTGDWE
jgi:hypothetical protein